MRDYSTANYSDIGAMHSPSCDAGCSSASDADKSVLLAMSGGVDSSTAAIILAQDGYTLHGCTMALLEDSASACTQAADVAASLGFEHTTVELQQEFCSQVIDPFCQAYFDGQTPNPCVNCNRSLKFGELHELRERLGLNYLATGHYVRRVFDPDTGLFQLRRAADTAKDQSYFLSHMSQDALAKTLFPLGNLTKPEVRKVAQAAKLKNAQAPESQDICFIKDGDYVSFIERHTGKTCKPGPIKLEDGTVVGEHSGILKYTIGQRKGIGIAAPEPLYVVGIDAQSNAVIVGPKSSLMVNKVKAKDFSFVGGAGKTDKKLQVSAQTHYRHKPVAGAAIFDEAGNLVVELDEPIVKPAPGQTLALYEGDLVIGGGIICN